MKSSNLLATALALVACGGIAKAQFMDNFDDGNASTRWSTPIVDSEIGTFDGSVDYAFDYTGIAPPAPNGGGPIGVRIFANQTDESDEDEGESIGIIANDAVMPSGDFVLKADVYYVVNSGFEDIGTEYVTFGAFTGAVNAPSDFGLNDDVPFRFGVSDGNGLAWQVTGDGGSATDLVRFEDPDNLNAGSQTNLGSLDDIPFGTIPGVTTGGGNPNNPFEQFGLQNRWVTLSIESSGGMIDYKINGAVIDTIDNTLGTFSGGSVLIGLNDVFNSAAAEGVYTIFDNVMLVPEPSSLVILGSVISVIGVAARKRRK